MRGTIADVVRVAETDVGWIIQGLASQLQLEANWSVHRVFVEFQQQSSQWRELQRKLRSRRFRRASGRRELRQSLKGLYPELAESKWFKSNLLKSPDQQETVAAAIMELPEYAQFQNHLKRRQRLEDQKHTAELKNVKFRRLIQALETALLAYNLPLVAEDAAIEKYRRMRQLEHTGLQPNE